MPVATDKRIKKQAQGNKINFILRNIEPLTDNQKLVFDNYQDQNKHLLITGASGTGKTFMALYLGIKDIFLNNEQNKLIIVRSTVSTRDQGFLPGSIKDKSRVFEAAYSGIFGELFNRDDAYEVLKQKSIVEFLTTSYVRGITINDAIIIIDEIQNMTPSELHTIFTRIGKNCKVFLVGDIKQTDLNKHKELSGFADFIKIIHKMESFASVEFTRYDIVRSSIVKEYMFIRDELEEKGEIDIL